MVTDAKIIEERSRLVDELAAVAERLRQSTVLVRGRGLGSGSGVIWQSGGLIITNAHVAHGPRAVIEMWDGRAFDAAVKAKDPGRDLAALTVNADGLPAVEVGDSDALRVGELVLAVGNPLGLVGALSTGIIHAVGSLNGPGNISHAHRWVQADLRLAPGNSGGPLADARGRVIGINTMVAGGLALAVPSNAVADFLSDTHERPFLGVTLEGVLVPLGGTRVRGLLVLDVESGSPADRAGLTVGDVLVGAGGQSLNRPYDLARALSDAVRPGAGGKLQLHFLRAAELKACEAILRGGTEAA